MASTSTSKRSFSVMKVEGENEECGIFELDGEDHTLGNSLRFMLCRDPDVKFAGYSMPHPNEKKVLVQIQVYPGRGKTALDALELGLQRLLDVTHTVKSVFRDECIKKKIC